MPGPPEPKQKKPKKASAASAKKTAAKKPAAKAPSVKASTAAAKPTLVELIRGHLEKQNEPRSAAEITTALTQAHPDRSVKTTVVRTTLEGLVAKSHADRAEAGLVGLLDRRSRLGARRGRAGGRGQLSIRRSPRPERQHAGPSRRTTFGWYRRSVRATAGYMAARGSLRLARRPFLGTSQQC